MLGCGESIEETYGPALASDPVETFFCANGTTSYEIVKDATTTSLITDMDIEVPSGQYFAMFNCTIENIKEQYLFFEIYAGSDLILNSNLSMVCKAGYESPGIITIPFYMSSEGNIQVRARLPVGSNDTNILSRTLTVYRIDSNPNSPTEGSCGPGSSRVQVRPLIERNIINFNSAQYRTTIYSIVASLTFEELPGIVFGGLKAGTFTYYICFEVENTSAFNDALIIELYNSVTGLINYNDVSSEIYASSDKKIISYVFKSTYVNLGETIKFYVYSVLGGSTLKINKFQAIELNS